MKNHSHKMKWIIWSIPTFLIGDVVIGGLLACLVLLLLAVVVLRP